MKITQKIRDTYYKLGVMAAMPTLMASGAMGADDFDIDKLNEKASSLGSLIINIFLMGAFIGGLGILIWGLFEFKKGREEQGNKAKATIIIVVGMVLMGLSGILGFLGLAKGGAGDVGYDMGR
jgi:hypothetical protein